MTVSQEQAPEGELFTTYNFEVADDHTYFAGEAGVWVHNNCADDAKKLTRAFFGFKRKQGMNPVQAMEATLAQMPAGVEKKAILAFMRHANRQMARQGLYKDYDEWRALAKAKGLSTELDVEVHHLATKKVQEYLGIPEHMWDDSPAIPLTWYEHQASRAENPQAASRVLEKFGLGWSDLNERPRKYRLSVLLTKLDDAYAELGMENEWQVAKQWLLKQPRIIP